MDHFLPFGLIHHDLSVFRYDICANSLEKGDQQISKNLPGTSEKIYKFVMTRK